MEVSSILLVIVVPAPRGYYHRYDVWPVARSRTCN